MKKFVLLSLAGLTAIFGAASESSANGRYCLHYPGNPNCLAVFYDQDYGYAPPPQMVYQRRQIIYFAPPMVRYAQPYIYYGRRNEGAFNMAAVDILAVVENSWASDVIMSAAIT